MSGKIKKSLRVFSVLLPMLALNAQNVEIGFDAKPAENGLTVDWHQNKAPNFKPYGTVELIDAPYGKWKKALQIASTEKPTDVLLNKPIPVKVGDHFSVTVVFRSKNNHKARVGLYGMDKKGLCEYQAFEFTPINKEWDFRQTTFEVQKENTGRICFFLAANPNSSIEYSCLSYRKLSDSETTAFSPGKNRRLWKERTQGVNLAYKKKVTFHPEPNYSLTSSGGSDAADLTDGRLGKPNDMLWFDTEAVAWYRALHGVTVIVDLGSVQPVEKGVIRINGGRIGGTEFPRILEAWVSRDGKNFYQSHSMKKVAVTERDMTNWKELYYLPETLSDEAASPTYYVYPFELNVKADARYVAFRAPIYTSLMMITDELAVIKATDSQQKEEGYNSVYKKTPQPLVHESIIIQPRMEKFYVAGNMKLPNWLTVDNRLKDSDGKFSYTVDLPEQVGFTEEKSWPQFTRTFLKEERANGRVTYVFEPKCKFSTFLEVTASYQLGPFFFATEGKTVPENQKYAVFTTYYNGKQETARKLPLEIITIPEVPPVKHLNISLAWTENRHFMTWPDYLKTQKRLGFNVLPFFPLSKDAPQAKELIEKAEKEGFLIRQQMSPTAKMNAYNKGVTEYKCTSGHNLVRSACLAYRGKYYSQMLENIKNAVRDYPADFITFDEETWGTPHLNASMQCTRCDALRKSKKMEWKDFFGWAEAEYLKEFKKAVAEGAREGKKKMPVIGFYALRPDGTTSFQLGKVPFLGWNYLYPDYCDEIQDSYYGRDTAEAHKRARQYYMRIRNPKILVPWITGGAGAHCETAYSKRTGQHLIEVLMNGAGGVQYFMYPSFESPLDYYYHARTLSELVPFEDILMKGTLDESFRGSNDKLLYTARILGNRTLLLIGNYAAVNPAETVIKVNGKVRDLVRRKDLTGSGGTVKLTIPADDYGLYLITRDKVQ